VYAYDCKHFLVGKKPFCDVGRDLSECPCPRRHGVTGGNAAGATTFEGALDDLVNQFIERSAPLCDMRTALGKALLRLATLCSVVNPEVAGFVVRGVRRRRACCGWRAHDVRRSAPDRSDSLSNLCGRGRSGSRADLASDRRDN
jgi:hypothetical protein